jgi:protein-S-isoprenylcysteine O-methyltransferase Ste14
MPQTISSWFPSVLYANIYGIIVLGCFMLDQALPRLMGGKGGVTFWEKSDRGSFLFIYLSTFVGLAGGFYIRYMNIGLVPFGIQLLGLLILLVGLAIREWAIILLGRFFSRTVEIQKGHRLISNGPYRWIRHPAYTGMILLETGIILGLGTWVGALFMLLILLVPMSYRMRVEERALLETFGKEYRTYVSHTWRLFPGW